MNRACVQRLPVSIHAIAGEAALNPIPLPLVMMAVRTGLAVAYAYLEPSIHPVCPAALVCSLMMVFMAVAMPTAALMPLAVAVVPWTPAPAVSTAVVVVVVAMVSGSV